MNGPSDTAAGSETSIRDPLATSPAIFGDKIAFICAGDVWLVDKTGGEATRLVDGQGQATRPRFSPNGEEIAFSATIDRKQGIYCISSDGKEKNPRKLTHHPSEEILVDWVPASEHLRHDWVLYSSTMESSLSDYRQLYRLFPKTGTDGEDTRLAEKLPLEIAEFGAVSKTGMLAFQVRDWSHRTQRCFRGGSSPEILLLDLSRPDSQPVNIKCDDANDYHPMWSADGKRLYFLSDRGRHDVAQFYEMDFNGWDGGASPEAHRVTKTTRIPIRRPSMGLDEIVYEQEGRIYRLCLNSKESTHVETKIDRKLFEIPPQPTPLAPYIQGFDLHKDGEQALFEARGKIFTVSSTADAKEEIAPQNRFAKRYPSWSPDGQHIAYFTDRDGEYQLAVTKRDAPTSEKILTRFRGSYRYRPFWSPNSAKLAFINHNRVIQIYDLESGELTTVDEDIGWIFHFGLAKLPLRWSPCSRWLTYSRKLDNLYNGIFLYDTELEALHQVTSGFYHEIEPVFDPAGEYLFFLSCREFSSLQGGMAEAGSSPTAPASQQ